MTPSVASSSEQQVKQNPYAIPDWQHQTDIHGRPLEAGEIYMHAEGGGYERLF